MFEKDKQPTYEAFFVDDEPDTDAVRVGLEWLKDWGSGAEAGVVVTPVTNQLQHSRLTSITGPMKSGEMYRLDKRRIFASTFRTFPPGSWDGGPVLALWASEKFLDQLHEEHRVQAVCVVPSSIADISAWKTSVGAVDLASGESTDKPMIGDPVVERAMVSLTIGINQNNRLITHDEKSEAVLTLEILRDGGHQFTAGELHSWALANGWHADTARQLQEYAEGVLSGRRYQISRGIFRPEVLEHWRSEAGKS